MVALIAVAVVLPTLTLAQAQQPPAIRADIAGIRDGEFPHAVAVINLEDSSGAAIGALGPGNFSVKIDGHSVPVVSADLASSGNLPLDVLFVMDTSGSMAGEPIARAKQAAKEFIRGLSPNDRVALLSFADEVRLMQDYTVDRAAIGGAVDGLTARGNTALYQATANTAIKLTTSIASRRAVIFLSDGAQDGVPPTIGREAAIAAAAGIGVSFFAIGEGRSIDRAYLQQLADVTHGRYLEAPNPAELGALYASVGQLLRSQYVVTFDASSAGVGGSDVTIAVNAAGTSTTATAAYKPGADFQPQSVTIEGVAAGESISAVRTITVRGATEAGGARASFYVDGVNVFETEKPPYAYVFDPAAFGGGEHTVRVSIEAPPARAVDASVSFSSVVPPKPDIGGSAPPLPLLLGGGIGLVLAVAVFVALRVRTARRGEASDAGRVVPFAKPILTRGLPPTDLVEDDSAPAPVVVEPLGILISRGGSDLGMEYSVGGNPVSIGSGSRCAVRVEDAELTAEEARIWIRKGHLMVHKMTRLTAMVVDGSMGGWEILEPGDTFTIGQHVFEFRLLPEEEPAVGAGDGSDIPNVLRDPDVPPRAVNEPRTSNFSNLMPRSD
jgi:VWFA-related protein